VKSRRSAITSVGGNKVKVVAEGEVIEREEGAMLVRKHAGDTVAISKSFAAESRAGERGAFKASKEPEGDASAG
jgi:hypothetical protein